MTTPPSNERFSLLVEAGPGDVPGIQRLRALLKQMWRGYRLRVVEISEVTPPDAQAPAENARKGEA